jgi:hypothetical protein
MKDFREFLNESEKLKALDKEEKEALGRVAREFVPHFSIDYYDWPDGKYRIPAHYVTGNSTIVFPTYKRAQAFAEGIADLLMKNRPQGWKGRKVPTIVTRDTISVTLDELRAYYREDTGLEIDDVLEEWRGSISAKKTGIA